MGFICKLALMLPFYEHTAFRICCWYRALYHSATGRRIVVIVVPYQGDAPPLSQLFLDEHDHVVHGVEILRHNIASLLLLVYNGMRDTNTQMGPRAARSCSAWLRQQRKTILIRAATWPGSWRKRRSAAALTRIGRRRWPRRTPRRIVA